jgi:hypothetical protein
MSRRTGHARIVTVWVPFLIYYTWTIEEINFCPHQQWSGHSKEPYMMLAIDSLAPRADKIHVVRDNECETWRSDYTERKVGVPQVLLVEQKIPGSRILPHFHDLDQFQVFMDNPAKVGSHEISPISIHYTNGYTGYGPIVAGEQGSSYYVFRPDFDSRGSHYLHVPESRAKLKPGGKRVLLANGVKLMPQEELSKLGVPRVERIMGVKADDPDAGVFVDAVNLGPDMRFIGSLPQEGGGQVFLLVHGAITSGGTRLAGRASLVVTNAEPAVMVTAGNEGAQLLIFQYPRRA